MREEKLTIFPKKEEQKMAEERMTKHHEVFVKAAKSLQLYMSQDAPTSIPENFQEAQAEELGNKKFLDALAKCYLNVFGSGDIWGEGAICGNCGKVIPLEKYEAEGGSGCNCGGKFNPYYNQEEFQYRIREELGSEYKTPFCMTMKSENNPEQIDGFCWGVIDTKEKIAERIVKNRYKEEPEVGEEVRRNILQNLPTEEKYLFFDELGVKKEARGGIGPVVFLTRMGFEKAVREKAKSALFWTSRMSPIHNICVLSGFREMYHTPDGLVFLYLEDYKPLLKVMQNYSIKEDAEILRESAEYLEKQ